MSSRYTREATYILTQHIAMTLDIVQNLAPYSNACLLVVI